MIAGAGTARSWRGGPALLVATLCILAARQSHAQCVGDCVGDGQVTISDLILGVNIALGSQSASACPAFADHQGEVTIAQLILGVNNALEGCPPPAATATATATSPAATATMSGTAVPSAPATATTVPTTATATRSPTVTGVPTGTASATATLPPATGIPTGTATATAPATPVDSATPTPSATQAPSATPTGTAIPPGDSIAGRAALLSTGLGGIQGLIAAVVTAATNNGGAALVHGVEQGLPPPIESDECPISGTTTQSCTEMGADPSKTISLVLGATNCAAPGPLGGSGEFDGTISIDSTPFVRTSCNPLRFVGGGYDVTNLTVILRDAMMNLAITISANLDGNLNITGVSASCLVSSLSLTLNGTLSSLLPDGTGVQVQFQNTPVMMSDITYSDDCVPLVYTLQFKFNGNAVFTPLQGALLEVSAPLAGGTVPSEQPFAVTFIDFILTQDATASPVKVRMDGTISSPCFGGQLILDTLTPVAVAAGQLCPNSGTIAVNGGDNGNATISYADGGVTVTPEGGQGTVYASCLASELLMCPAS